MIKGSLFFTILVSGVMLLAGQERGGGPGIVCTDAQRKVQSAQTYDLYEGKILFGLSISESQEPVDQQLAEAVAKTKAYNYFIGADFEEALNYIKSHFEFLPEGVVMGGNVTDLGTSYPPVVPEGCSLQYVGYYQADGNIKISKTVYDKMSLTSRAALLAHEAFYKLARAFSTATTSEDARRFTATMFSTDGANALDSIASHLTWNQSRFYWSDGLQSPVKAEGKDNHIIMIFSNPHSRNAHFELSCQNDLLETVSVPTKMEISGTDTIVELLTPSDCKLLRIVRNLTGGMQGDWGNLAELEMKFVYAGKTFLDIQNTEMAQKPGIVYEAFAVPVYFVP